MLKIGEFSKLNRIPIKTLRYYDEIGLLVPDHVDEWTGYRYYNFNQIARLNRIFALKDLGFSLEQIRALLDGDVTAEQMRGMLTLRRADIQTRLMEESDRLARIELRLRQIELEDKMPEYDVVIKKVEVIRVASVRGIVPTPPEQGVLWRALEGYLAMHRVKPLNAPCLSLYHDEDTPERDWDIEVCEPIDAELPESQNVKVVELPVIETMACAVHNGPFVTIGDAYNAIGRWISENGYHVIGPCREVYLKPARNGSQTDPQTVTEIQFPVAK